MGVPVDGAPRVDLDLLRAHKEGVVGGMVEAHAEMFRNSDMDFVLGTARFGGERTLEITLHDADTRLVRGRDVLINTGPRLPPRGCWAPSRRTLGTPKASCDSSASQNGLV